MDIGDRGQALSDQHLARSLAAHNDKANTSETELIGDDGQFLCLGCEDDIPSGRVEALHAAGYPALRCRECQAREERW